MSFIGTHILFLITLAFLQTNGCFNEETIELFYNIDLDGNGFVTYEEFCQAGIQSEDKEECDELWNSFDWNKDDKITCQESLIAEIIRSLDLLKDDELGDRLKMVFANKPDNCSNISVRELALLTLPMPDQFQPELDEQMMRQSYQMMDRNKDGNLACNEFLSGLMAQISQMTIGLSEMYKKQEI